MATRARRRWHSVCQSQDQARIDGTGPNKRFTVEVFNIAALAVEKELVVDTEDALTVFDCQGGVFGGTVASEDWPTVRGLAGAFPAGVALSGFSFVVRWLLAIGAAAGFISEDTVRNAASARPVSASSCSTRATHRE